MLVMIVMLVRNNSNAVMLVRIVCINASRDSIVCEDSDAGKDSNTVMLVRIVV